MNTSRIGVIGLGYVGLPLALELSKKYNVLGYDINPVRINALKKAEDFTRETDSGSLFEALQRGIVFSADESELSSCSVYIVTVPTPIDHNNQPDLRPLLSASATIAQFLKQNDVVIYESTTYPGCTEEECVPMLEKGSGLRYNIDFFCGYSPERINPGDRVNTLTRIKKVTSGSTPEAATFVDKLYSSIIEAGTHLAPSIKVAEASKAIENAQRDLNISFVNELALIFDRLGVDTNDVLDAASTKWNFLRFNPGLVGGHCISVDPYYLTYKSQQAGYEPEVILSGRRVNNSIPSFIASKLVKLLINKGKTIKNSRVLILGVTFKENCPDIRNSKIPQVKSHLENYGMKVDVFDPWAMRREVQNHYGFNLLPKLPAAGLYNAVILSVGHEEFKQIKVRSLLKDDHKGVVFDIKAFLDRSQTDCRL